MMVARAGFEPASVTSSGHHSALVFGEHCPDELVPRLHAGAFFGHEVPAVAGFGADVLQNIIWMQSRIYFETPALPASVLQHTRSIVRKDHLGQADEAICFGVDIVESS
jgi:hypothetical protein